MPGMETSTIGVAAAPPRMQEWQGLRPPAARRLDLVHARRLTGDVGDARNQARKEQRAPHSVARRRESRVAWGAGSVAALVSTNAPIHGRRR
jgi:hypothetical protein